MLMRQRGICGGAGWSGAAGLRGSCSRIDPLWECGLANGITRACPTGSESVNVKKREASRDRIPHQLGIDDPFDFSLPPPGIKIAGGPPVRPAGMLLAIDDTNRSRQPRRKQQLYLCKSN